MKFIKEFTYNKKNLCLKTSKQHRKITDGKAK